MEIYVLNPSFEVTDPIDEFSSLIWTERYREVGDFELVIPANSSALQKIKMGDYLMITESRYLMIVEKIFINENVEEGDTVEITGRSLESILDRRIVWGQETYENKTCEEIVRSLLTNSFINPGISSRKVSNFVYQAAPSGSLSTETMSVQFYGESILEAVTQVLEHYDYGYQITLNSQNQFVFQILTGQNRSYTQMANPFVVFSYEFENVTETRYTEDQTEVKNVVLVAGEGEGADRKVVSVGDASGLARKEMFKDAETISSTSEEEISDAEYLNLLRQQGRNALNEVALHTEFDGELEVYDFLEYRVDYELGDIVQIENKYGYGGQARVTEMIFSCNVNGIKNYPTFTNI